jgi:hypothetical protein
MQFKRIEPGSYKATTRSADFTAMIDRDESGKWFWTVQRNGGGTLAGFQHSLDGAKDAVRHAIAYSRAKA